METKTLESKTESEKESVCKHVPYCMVKQFGRDCSYPSYENCQTYKYYNKYGLGGCFIGSMRVSLKRTNGK